MPPQAMRRYLRPRRAQPVSALKQLTKPLDPRWDDRLTPYQVRSGGRTRTYLRSFRSPNRQSRVRHRQPIGPPNGRRTYPGKLDVPTGHGRCSGRPAAVSERLVERWSAQPLRRPCRRRFTSTLTAMVMRRPLGALGGRRGRAGPACRHTGRRARPSRAVGSSLSTARSAPRPAGTPRRSAARRSPRLVSGASPGSC
jgi:hypothetical protein